ncbi:MAG: hypothetical protein P8J32_03690 [bacterium]|nr:hypothetical protein [bacterium]
MIRSLLALLPLAALLGCPDNDKEIDTGTEDFAYIVIVPTDNSDGKLLRATFSARGGGGSTDQVYFTQATGLSDDNTVLEVTPSETVWAEATAVMEFGEGNDEDDGSSANLSLTEVLHSCAMDAGDVNTVTAEVYCSEDATALDDCDFDFNWSANTDHDRDSGCATLADTSTDDGDDSSSSDGGSIFGGGFGGFFGG